MGVNIRGRSFLTLLDFTPEEINYLLDLASEFKKLKANGVDHSFLKGKQVVLLFEKTSTRTRCAFEVGARDLGMGVTFLDSKSSQMGKK
ncbi:MAG: ornithine carbamoyltransferase, partial [Bulleidia sp.]